jgi:hypothetical protein
VIRRGPMVPMKRNLAAALLVCLPLTSRAETPEEWIALGARVQPSKQNAIESHWRADNMRVDHEAEPSYSTLFFLKDYIHVQELRLPVTRHQRAILSRKFVNCVNCLACQRTPSRQHGHRGGSRQISAKLLTKDKAQGIAANVAKLPELLQTTK